MKIFDREAPGEGVELKCSLKNGKARLEWKVHLKEIPEVGGREADGQNSLILHLCLVDNCGNVAVECVQDLREEEPLVVVVFQPKLWQGVENPYLYELEAVLSIKSGKCLDRLCRKQPLRELEMRKVSPDLPEQLFLNGERFVCRGVTYVLSDRESGAKGQVSIYDDLQKLLDMGANIICVEAEGNEAFFLQLCEKMGFLVGRFGEEKENIKATHVRICGQGEEFILDYEDKMPIVRGKQNALMLSGSGRRTTLYYRYKAMWSKKPFIYIIPESIRRLTSGNYQVTCYSNVKRVALYSDGNFFEVQNSEVEFVFWEVPAKGPSLILSAEGEGCSTSFSIHKTFTFLSPIGDN